MAWQKGRPRSQASIDKMIATRRARRDGGVREPVAGDRSAEVAREPQREGVLTAETPTSLPGAAESTPRAADDLTRWKDAHVVLGDGSPRGMKGSKGRVTLVRGGKLHVRVGAHLTVQVHPDSVELDHAYRNS